MANKTLQLKIGNTTYRSSVDNTLTNEDLNNVTLPGLYNAGGSNSVTNKPSGIDHFGLLVIHRASGSYYIQIIYNDSKSYRRFCTNGTWSKWTEDKLTDTTYTSLKNPCALTLKINSGGGTAYDGSSPITYDITKTALGMNKVDNTADVDKSVKHAKTANSATTAATLGSATIGSTSCGIYLSAGKPTKMNATVGSATAPIYFLNGTATACSLTKSSVGLGSVDNTSDANKTVNKANKLKLLSSNRPASLNFDLTKDPYMSVVTYALATSSTTTGKCPSDGHVLTFGWDTTAGWGSQMAITDGSSPKVYVRGAKSENNASVWDTAWKTLAFTSDITWGNVSGKPSTFTPASHTHTKSQITDFPSSLKNPTALTIQGNGTTIASYDGSVAKTVNITKSSVGLGSVDNTADANKSVKYATSAGSANAVAWGSVSGKPSTFSPSSHTHSKSDVGLGNVDNTADSAKSVKYATSAGSASSAASATKFQTYKADSTTETYGDSYQAYMQWQNDNTLKLICTGYKTRVDIADSALPLSGGTLTGQVNFGSGSYYVKSDGSANFRTVTGAIYNDYAEFFPRGEATEPGDIVALDLTSDHESYIKATATSKIVAGVHSDEYAMLIGGDKVEDGNYVEKNLVNYIPVSLAGRVMCKVTGPVHRGDTIIVSEIPGVGITTDDENIPHKRVVGYVVEDDDRTDIRRVKIRVKG